MEIYVAYDREWPYLPIAVADTGKELAKMTGKDPNAVYTAIAKGFNTFKKVTIDDEA